jgi:hypothetical protein
MKRKKKRILQKGVVDKENKMRVVYKTEKGKKLNDMDVKGKCEKMYRF